MVSGIGGLGPLDPHDFLFFIPSHRLLVNSFSAVFVFTAKCASTAKLGEKQMSCYQHLQRCFMKSIEISPFTCRKIWIPYWSINQKKNSTVEPFCSILHLLASLQQTFSPLKWWQSSGYFQEPRMVLSMGNGWKWPSHNAHVLICTEVSKEHSRNPRTKTKHLRCPDSPCTF